MEFLAGSLAKWGEGGAFSRMTGLKQLAPSMQPSSSQPNL